MKADLSIFKACSDATRLRILFLLAIRELCVCELVSVLEIPQGKISRHLALLKQAGVVEDRRDGTWIYYSLSEANTALKRHLADYLRKTWTADETATSDREQLDTLTAQGQICVPNPVYIPVTSTN